MVAFAFQPGTFNEQYVLIDRVAAWCQMMTMEHLDIDLIALAALLEKKTKYKGLAHKIKLVASAGSAFQDLKHAQEAMHLLHEYQSAPSPRKAEPRESTSVGALFAHAVILYSRATTTRTPQRLQWFGEAKLTPGEREWHRQIIRYRDEVVAHYGRGEHLKEGPSVKDVLVMRVPKGPTNQVVVQYIESRAQTRASLSAKLTLLLTKTLALVQACFQERLDNLQPEMFPYMRDDLAFAQLAKRCLFDDAELRAMGWQSPLDLRTGEVRYVSVPGKSIIRGDS